MHKLLILQGFEILTSVYLRDTFKGLEVFNQASF